MEEQRKRRAPGIQIHVNAIRDINNQINTLTERVTEYKDKIETELQRTNEKSENSRIRTEVRSLDDAIRALKAKKTEHLEEKTKLSTEFNGLKEGISTEKRKINFSSLEELEKREKEINYKLMTSPVTSQQEREISALLCDIKKKRVDLQNLSTKESRLAFLNKRLGELSSIIRGLNGEIDENKKKIDALKTELQSLTEKGKTKNDVVVEHERKIEEFKKTKMELYEKRKREQAEIVKKEEAHEKYMQTMAEMQEQENQRKVVKSRIKKLEDERDVLLKEQAHLGSEKFDEIVRSLTNIVPGKNLSLPIALVQRLTSVGMPLPKDMKDIAKTIDGLKSAKEKFSKNAFQNVRNLEGRINSIDTKISEERKILDSMPEPEVKPRRDREFAY